MRTVYELEVQTDFKEEYAVTSKAQAGSQQGNLPSPGFMEAGLAPLHRGREGYISYTMVSGPRLAAGLGMKLHGY